jgi:3,4-dihydroxy 2-butanone 4-phosphate synthase / GTP cyclohydrolase II
MPDMNSCIAMPDHSDLYRDFYVGIEELIAEARQGRMFILADGRDGKSQGNLVLPAQMVTAQEINFMAKHGRGLIRLALTKERSDALGLALIPSTGRDRLDGAFTASIEAQAGVTTGISAFDRARTIAVAIDDSSGPDDIVSPGHVFPLVAHEGGVLMRPGYIEAAVDIARLANLNPSSVICQVLNEKGAMAQLKDLVGLARRHDLRIGSIRDLIAYRAANES